MPRNFEMKVRVRLPETDALGVVYYGQYLTYFDLARLEMLRKVGITLDYLKRKNLGFVAAEVNCKYFASARFDEVLRLSVGVSKMGSSSVTYAHTVGKGRTRLAEGRVTDVLVGKSGRPTSMSPDLRRRLSTYAAEL